MWIAAVLLVVAVNSVSSQYRGNSYLPEPRDPSDMYGPPNHTPGTPIGLSNTQPSRGYPTSINSLLDDDSPVSSYPTRPSTSNRNRNSNGSGGNRFPVPDDQRISNGRNPEFANERPSNIFSDSPRPTTPYDLNNFPGANAGAFAYTNNPFSPTSSSNPYNTPFSPNNNQFDSPVVAENSPFAPNNNRGGNSPFGSPSGGRQPFGNNYSPFGNNNPFNSNNGAGSSNRNNQNDRGSSPFGNNNNSGGRRRPNVPFGTRNSPLTSNNPFGANPNSSPFGSNPNNSPLGSNPNNSPFGSNPNNSPFGSNPNNSPFGSNNGLGNNNNNNNNGPFGGSNPFGSNNGLGNNNNNNPFGSNNGLGNNNNSPFGSGGNGPFGPNTLQNGFPSPADRLAGLNRNQGIDNGSPGTDGDPQSDPADYIFQYQVNDSPTGQDFGHREARRGDDTRGEYYVALPDGRMQRVQYTAGVNGYNAQVSYVNPPGGLIGGDGAFPIPRQRFSRRADNSGLKLESLNREKRRSQWHENRRRLFLKNKH